MKEKFNGFVTTLYRKLGTLLKQTPRNPSLAADVVVIREIDGVDKVLMILRKNYPYGWALPGGFVDYGEGTDVAAARELEEETTLKTDGVYQLGVFSKPDRDPRGHVVSVAYVAPGAEGEPEAKDDAKLFGWFELDKLPELAFPDHKDMIDLA